MSQTNSTIKKTYPPESRVILYGSSTETAESAKRLRAQGREVVVQARANWDTGVGQCGQHLCHCNGNCKMQFEQTV